MRATHSKRRAASLLTALVLAANALVVGAGWVDQPDAGDIVTATAPDPRDDVVPTRQPTDLDPLAGLVFEVPLPSQVDPNAVLPVPEPAPVNAYARTPEIRHGTLEIPKIGVSQTLFEGVTLTAINRGPSHWPGTAMPGEVGNVVVAGHRTTYSRPFYRLNELAPGDELVFTIAGERIVYALERIEIVRPHDVHIIDQTADRTATLFACHPRGSARQRIVGHFRMKPPTVSVAVPDVGSAARELLRS